MKIGIVTFHCARNYGAVLQCRALYEVLKSMGHDVHVINYRPDAVTKPYWLWQDSFLLHPVKLIKVALNFPPELRRKMAFERFEKTFSPVPPRYSLDMDAMVYGSDQIWNLRITGGDTAYFGAIDMRHGKKIAYAASCGDGHIPDEMLKGYMPMFHRIGVREESLQKTLKTAGFSSELCLDPVLLAGDMLLEKLDAKCPVNRGYVLTYEAMDNTKVGELAVRIASERKLRVESVSRSPYAKGIARFGPEEFVALIRNADCVVTSSFHAVALSILLKKEYIYCQSGTAIDDRINGLLAQLEKHSLEELRSKSMAFLEEALQ